MIYIVDLLTDISLRSILPRWQLLMLALWALQPHYAQGMDFEEESGRALLGGLHHCWRTARD
jgi:hypothetical protein